MKRLLLIIVLLLLPVLASAQSGAAEQQIGPQEIEQVLNDYLADQSERLPHIELRFASIALPKPFKVPAGQIEYQVIPAKPGVIGSRRVTLLTRVDGQVADNRSIRVELEALAEILIAADNLRRGEVISPDKVSYLQQDISKLKQPLFDGDEVFGKRLKRSIRLGQPLLRKQVEFPPLIKRGDRVTIQAQRGGLMLTAAGEAKENGMADETIRVINLGSRKVVLCRVVEAGLVMVEF
jgi:flagella basal body P-ring formation protein FlgA